MAIDHYRFASTWSLGDPPSRVFHALVDLAAYPDWWPDVRAVRRVGPDTAEIVCRSTLPYRLTLHATRAEQDETAGRLRLELRGDLVGHVRCLVRDHGEGTGLDIRQEVRVRNATLRRLSWFARPLLRANHAVMMRRGERGLRAYLNLPGSPYP